MSVHLMCGSCHNRNALISVEYQNCCRTLAIYVILVNFDGENSFKIDLHICNLWTGQFVSYESVI